MGKYDHLFFTIPPEYHSWEGYASPRAGFGGEAEMPGAKMYMGFSVSTKEGVMEIPHIHHGIDEYLVFTGADLADFFGSFDAEAEVWIGDNPNKLEKVTITEPTVIRVPPNLWHCPIHFKRVGKPVCFIPLYLDGHWSKINRQPGPDGRDMFIYDGAGIRRCVMDPDKLCTYCGKCFSQAVRERQEQARKEPEDPLRTFREMEKNPRTGAFDQYVYPIKPEASPLGEAFVSPRGRYPGHLAEPEAHVTFSYDVVKAPCSLWDEPHMHHAAEEYLFFTGYDLMDPFASFDAEIEVMIGPDPDHLESHILTAPTVIRIPPNVWHGPVRFRRVGKPVNFLPFYYDGYEARITRERAEDGTWRYRFTGEGLPE